MKREQGEGKLEIIMGEDGRVRAARMVRSTGSEVLDAHTVKFVRAKWRGPSGERRVTTVDYRLGSGRGASLSFAVHWRPTPASNAYAEAVKGTLRNRWLETVRARADPEMTSGERVQLKFFVWPSGEVAQVNVVGKTSWPALTATCVEALRETRFPPIPANVWAEARRQDPKCKAACFSFASGLR